MAEPTYAEPIPAAPLRAEFRYQENIRGELQRVWEVADGTYQVHGAHVRGPWWDVYLLKRTPDGHGWCGHSFVHVGKVPGGLGRDERIVELGLTHLITEYTHDPSSCAVCTPRALRVVS